MEGFIGGRGKTITPACFRLPLAVVWRTHCRGDSIERGGLCWLPGGQLCGLDGARATQNLHRPNLVSALIVLCSLELSTGLGIQQVLNKSLMKEGRKKAMSHAQIPGMETSEISLALTAKLQRRHHWTHCTDGENEVQRKEEIC